MDAAKGNCGAKGGGVWAMRQRRPTYGCRGQSLARRGIPREPCRSPRRRPPAAVARSASPVPSPREARAYASYPRAVVLWGDCPGPVGAGRPFTAAGRAAGLRALRAASLRAPSLRSAEQVGAAGPGRRPPALAIGTGYGPRGLCVPPGNTDRGKALELAANLDRLRAVQPSALPHRRPEPPVPGGACC